jgi:hypothetical protein
MSRMTLFSLTGAIALIGCATSTPADLFESTYRFRDPKEPGYFLVLSVPPKKWSVRGSPDGKVPLQLHPLSETQPMVLAPLALVAAWFDDQSPRDKIACLSSSGRYSEPLICRIPVNASYRLNQALSASSRSTTSTGYVLVVPTAAGVVAVDLLRTE